MSATRSASALSILVFAGALTAAPKALFPEPLHITREVSLSPSAPKAIVDEYCYGNRIVSVSGKRTAIVDHDKGELTVIDFAAATYSIAKFEELAAANVTAPRNASTAPRNDWRVEARGNNVIEAERKTAHESHHIRVTVDRQRMLTRAAVEALMGWSYPNARDAAADVVIGAMRAERSRVITNTASPTDAAEYHLPLEYIVRSEVGGESLEAHYVVIRVGNELVPADKIAIPAGAKRVEPDVIAARRGLEELDRLPLPEPR